MIAYEETYIFIKKILNLFIFYRRNGLYISTYIIQAHMTRAYVV